MWFGKNRLLQDVVASLKAENSDLRAQVRFLTQTSHDRETKLIDRILAVSQPAAHREIHPPPPRPTAVPQALGEHQRRINFPGSGMLPPPAPRPNVLGVEEPKETQGSSAESERRVHTSEVEGSSPSPATTPKDLPGEMISWEEAEARHPELARNQREAMEKEPDPEEPA